MDAPYSNIKHVIGMFWNCHYSFAQLNDLEVLKELFIQALSACNTEIIKIDHHEFHPQGVTIIAILADSHAVLHTWPENKFVMAEIFTCGSRSTPLDGIRMLISLLKPSYHKIEDTIMHL
ncbi:MAG: adenosylmethionine decarboxylase [Promethearchaeota archaeon]